MESGRKKVLDRSSSAQRASLCTPHLGRPLRDKDHHRVHRDPQTAVPAPLWGDRLVSGAGARSRPHTGREQLKDVLERAADSGDHSRGEARQGAGAGHFRGAGRCWAEEWGKGHHTQWGTTRRVWGLGGPKEEDLELGSAVGLWNLGTRLVNGPRVPAGLPGLPDDEKHLELVVYGSWVPAHPTSRRR